jgi:hypothetical protein
MTHAEQGGGIIGSPRKSMRSALCIPTGDPRGLQGLRGMNHEIGKAAPGLECSVCGSPSVGVNRRRKPPGANMRILTLLTSALLVAYASLVSAASVPAPPRVPRNFRWKGRYLVKDLGVDVPFSWQGKDGNLQMTAGSNGEDPIYFTNVLFDNELYTVTYRWPGIVLPDPVPCVCLGGLTLEKLNGCLSTSRYVGPEILADRSVKLANHFRISVVLGDTELKPDPVRLPIMQGDFYVDQGNPTKIWKVLHFGLQNILDPALDEWILLKAFKTTAGNVTLPAECESVTCPPHDVFDPGFYFCK